MQAEEFTQGVSRQTVSEPGMGRTSEKVSGCWAAGAGTSLQLSSSTTNLRRVHKESVLGQDWLRKGLPGQLPAIRHGKFARRVAYVEAVGS